TDVPGVFAGGDAVTGPATVIEAIAAGKRAAESIGRYLRGEDLATGRALEAPDISGIEYYTPPVVEPRARARMPKLPLVERRGFAEIHLGFDEAQAVSEAERCLSCSVCSECLECVQVCQPQAINHKAQPRSIALDVGAILWADGSGPERGGVQIAPDDVMGASAAAARVMLDLFRYRERPSVPPIPLVPSVPSGMAVFLCRCGGEISDVVDLAAMGEALRRLPDVALVEEVAFACHPDGAQAIERAIAERGLGRAVLAACSCCALDQICYSCSTQRLRCKGNLLRNPRGPAHPRFEFVNIREHCAFVHRDDPAAATAKATELVAAAVARARLAEPWPRGAMAVRTMALIVGRGPGAEASAEALTALGFRVVRAEADAIEGIRGGAGDFAVDERGGRPLRAGAIILAVRSDDERARLVSAFGAESLLQARDPLWAPVESWVPGIFLADSAVAGWAAAARAVGLLGRGWVQIQPIVARVDVARCRGCGDCVAVCPFGALRLVEEDPPRSPRWQGEEGLAVAQVSEALCQGCGACLAHCPTGAITAGSSSDRQVEAMLEAMLA
ncbi:MAG TPA: 4Fe-4S dicluster domain-containing protein, partial [Anaerolineae bacterium]|nr:4Fe-4S dicluster domain-containing protein [Anaerolineae bacterium]